VAVVPIGVVVVGEAVAVVVEAVADLRRAGFTAASPSSQSVASVTRPRGRAGLTTASGSPKPSPSASL
jgi:hypothetical protein